MSFARSIRSLSGGAGLLLLAACAGSQVAPAGPAGAPALGSAREAGTRSWVSPVANRALGAEILQRALASHAYRRLVAPIRIAFHDVAPIQTRAAKPPAFSYLFLSDNITGNLDTYNAATGAQIGSSDAGVCGWGLTTYTVKKVNLIACGSTSMGIITGSVTQTATTFNGQLTPSAFAAGGEAYGLTWDSKGDLYGTNFPSSGSSSTGNCIDYFSVATVAKGNGAGPDNTYCSAKFSYLYFLTVDGAALIGDGYDTSLSYNGFQLASFTVKKTSGGKGSTKVLQDGLSTPSEGGFPGGVAVTGGHELYVNNQYGQILGFPKPYKVGGPSNQFVNWTFDPDDFTAICLDWSQANLWAADIYFLSGSTFETYGTANSVPLGTIGTLSTTPIYNGESYLGCGLEPTGKT